MVVKTGDAREKARTSSRAWIFRRSRRYRPGRTRERPDGQAPGAVPSSG
ncbi:MAG TPA: hypothetical protein VMB35_06945 [Methanomicrobiales archaeon]|nr:hypothetical protein [Methanomicrobiales archaeon]